MCSTHFCKPKSDRCPQVPSVGSRSDPAHAFWSLDAGFPDETLSVWLARRCGIWSLESGVWKTVHRSLRIPLCSRVGSRCMSGSTSGSGCVSSSSFSSSSSGLRTSGCGLRAVHRAPCGVYRRQWPGALGLCTRWTDFSRPRGLAISRLKGTVRAYVRRVNARIPSLSNLKVFFTEADAEAEAEAKSESDVGPRLNPRT